MGFNSDSRVNSKDIILSRKNWQRWFDDLELFFESTDIDYAIKQTIVEYAKVSAFKPSLTSTSAPTPRSEADLAGELNKLSLGTSTDKEKETARTVLNLGKQKEYRKASARCKLKINQGLDDIDRDFVRVHDDAKTRWDTLKAKYSRTTPQDVRGYLQQITSFKYGKNKNGEDVDMTIDSAWAILREARRRVNAADPGMAATFGETQLFGFLMDGLPLDFAVTKQALDAQPNLETYEKIDLLRRHEQDMEQVSESANVAGGRQSNKHGKRREKKPDSRETSPRAHRGCYFCDGTHNIADCEVTRQMLDMVASFKIKKEAKQKSKPYEKPRTSSRYDKDKSGKPSSFYRKVRPSGRSKGYAAKTSPDASDAEDESSGVDSKLEGSEDDHDEGAHMSKAEPSVPLVKELPKVRNNFEVVIPAKSSAPLYPSGTTAKAHKDEDTNMSPVEVVPENSLTNAKEDQGPIAPLAISKRSRDPGENETATEKREAKRVRAMIAQRIYELELQQSFDQDCAFLASGGTMTISLPKTYDEAVNDPEHGADWNEAIQEEIRSLIANGTWTEEPTPRGVNLVSTKWVFTIKTHADGTPERYKARLVARGFSQQYGEDYFDTFAPTVRMDTLRIFMAMIAAEDFECRQFDIKNAFTEASMKERIFLSKPDGVPVRAGYSLRVLRSLYGLKQSVRDWNLLCKSYLLEIGFLQSLADPCLFTHAERGIKMLLYVDDIAAAAKTVDQLDWFFATMKKRFHIKDLGGIEKILGIRVTRNRATRELWLDQEQYIEKILDRMGLPTYTPNFKPKRIPIEGKYEKLEPAVGDEPRCDLKKYQQDIGGIMYAMVYTRPDISFVTGQLSQNLKDPARRHENAVKRLGRYLRSTITQKIRYGPTKHTSARLKIYTDADWANMKGRKSISGSTATLYGGPVSWGSRKQKSVATASTEAEYISMASNCKQGLWIAQVLKDMGFAKYIGKDKNRVDLRADNTGAIALAKNPHLHERSKHIDICYHFIRDLVETRKLSTTYIPTDKMVADGFTKPLDTVAKFERFKHMLGLQERVGAK